MRTRDHFTPHQSQRQTQCSMDVFHSGKGFFNEVISIIIPFIVTVKQLQVVNNLSTSSRVYHLMSFFFSASHLTFSLIQLRVTTQSCFEFSENSLCYVFGGY